MATSILFVEIIRLAVSERQSTKIKDHVVAMRLIVAGLVRSFLVGNPISIDTALDVLNVDHRFSGS
jgi:hypothetical protein